MYSEFRNILEGPKCIIEKKDSDIIWINPDGNCFNRLISYLLFNNQEYYHYKKALLIKWIENNYL